MTSDTNRGGGQLDAEQAVDDFKDELGPFVVAADTTRMPMLFTNAKSELNDIIYVNESFLHLTGYGRSDALGMPFHCILANECDRVPVILNDIATSNTSSAVRRCLRKDGTSFDGSVLVSPVCNKDGVLQQYFISLIDLTAHVETCVGEHLRNANLYKHTPGFIMFSQGSDHRLSFANAALEILVGHSDLVGRRVSEILSHLGDQSVVELLDHVYSRGQRVVGKCAPLRLGSRSEEEAQTKYIDFVFEPVRDASGAVVGLFCEGYDLTNVKTVSDELNDVQAQLMHVSRINAMGTMAATLAHEINQPLAAIVNYASGCVNILEQSGIQSPKLYDGLSAIAAASERAGRIIGRLRDMTKPTSRVSAVFDISSALEESVHLVRAGGCQNVSITTHLTPELFICGDKIQIEQVIINLLRNACQAAAQSEQPGTVQALSVIKNARACIVVCDNGPGFPIGIKDDPFRWTESAKAGGMGIGLSISRTIVEYHEGEIKVERTGPTGTCMIVSLPFQAR